MKRRASRSMNISDVKQAKWPEADFIVGNPPFIGGKDIRAELGDGYVKALRKAYDDWFPIARTSSCIGGSAPPSLPAPERFAALDSSPPTASPGLQSQSGRAESQTLRCKARPLSLIFAIPDHPWLKSALRRRTSGNRSRRRAHRHDRGRTRRTPRPSLSRQERRRHKRRRYRRGTDGGNRAHLRGSANRRGCGKREAAASQ